VLDLATLEIHLSSNILMRDVLEEAEGGRGREKQADRKRGAWVNDLACLTAVLLAGRSGTSIIDFQQNILCIYTHEFAWT
jgi:hypothetical protein